MDPDEEYTESDVSLEGKLPSFALRDDGSVLLLFAEVAVSTEEIQEDEAGEIIIGWADADKNQLQSLTFKEGSRLKAERSVLPTHILDICLSND